MSAAPIKITLDIKAPMFCISQLRNLLALKPQEPANSTPFGVVDEVPLQSTAWRYPASGARNHPAGLHPNRRRYSPRRPVERPCAYVRIGATETGGERPYAADKRALVAQGRAGISAIEETLLGLSLFGQGILFNRQRCHHGRHRTAGPQKLHF